MVRFEKALRDNLKTYKKYNGGRTDESLSNKNRIDRF